VCPGKERKICFAGEAERYPDLLYQSRFLAMPAFIVSTAKSTGLPTSLVFSAKCSAFSKFILKLHLKKKKNVLITSVTLASWLPELACQNIDGVNDFYQLAQSGTSGLSDILSDNFPQRSGKKAGEMRPSQYMSDVNTISQAIYVYVN